MSSPIERTSRADLNGAAHPVLLPGQRVPFRPVSAQVEPRRPRDRGYSWAELAERCGVSIPTLRGWVLSGLLPSRPRGGVSGAVGGPGAADAADFRAADVVRLEVLARLVRSGVPVARAAALVAETGDRAW
ncbi:MAG TPA: hypothetical protein VGX23_24380 [Actinocrinis sp.]|nr:hypothetical protein [Actinocrinis sp.]